MSVPTSVGEAEDLLLQFVAYLSFRAAVRYSTISSYVAGVSYRWLCLGYKGPVYTRTVKAALRGAERHDSQRFGGAPVKRLPFTADLVRSSRRVALELLDRPTAMSVAAAVVFGFFFLLRAGEFLSVSSRSVKVGHVRLQWGRAEQSRVIGLGDLGRSPMVGPPDRVIVQIPFSKSDTMGHGAVRVADRVPARDDRAVCVCSALWDMSHWHVWEAASQPIFPVSPALVSRVMKEAARREGLDPERVGLHSLRIGGAVQLSAAGLPDRAVMYAGRWASAGSLATYFRGTGELNASISRALGGPGPCTVDIGALYPRTAS